jgi:hypothetical protein
MRLLLGFTLLILSVHQSPAQSLTVHVLSESNHPEEGVLIRLDYGCSHSMRPIVLKQKTNAAGIAIFQSLSLTPLEFCVFPDDEYATREHPYVFTSPEDAARNYTKSINKVFTELPAEVTFHVRRRSFSERIRQLFSSD